MKPKFPRIENGLIVLDTNTYAIDPWNFETTQGESELPENAQLFIVIAEECGSCLKETRTTPDAVLDGEVFINDPGFPGPQVPKPYHFLKAFMPRPGSKGKAVDVDFDMIPKKPMDNPPVTTTTKRLKIV
jgi:hypothetical protein